MTQSSVFALSLASIFIQHLQAILDLSSQPCLDLRESVAARTARFLGGPITPTATLAFEKDLRQLLDECGRLIVQSVYKPFGEVGGDFFQVLPINAPPINNDPVSGGVLVIIGDVSGKGMPAAMTVSLLVGTVQVFDAPARQAHELPSPA